MNRSGSHIAGRRILLGVCGSIAAYKAVDILRRLKEQGAEVRVVMTRSAARFVAPLTFGTLSGGPVLTDEFTGWNDRGIGHIEITEGLDCALIAPATANIIGKIASGIADDALTTAVMALDCPLVISPAMNVRMYRNPVLRRNMAILRDNGVRIIEPEDGPLACGESGEGRLPGAETIVNEITSLFRAKDLAGVTVLVTAGPTRERIDAVRFISNPSTGKMGYAVAAAARDRGADVILISGPTHLAPPRGVKTVYVETAAEMRRAVMEHRDEARIVIMAAAVSDFRPADASVNKIRKEDFPPELRLERTDDILMELGRENGRHMLIGFATETDDLLENAKRKLVRKNLDLIVANNIKQPGAGFACDTNSVTIIDRGGRSTELPLMKKSEIASRIIDNIVELKEKPGITP